MSNPRTIKLLCPSVSNLIQFVAWDEQGLDLGSIARAFGLDPSTVKLNGHFISRGFDFVSSSVTWRSLLKFFSAKGLSTGKDDEDALIVDGKLSKVGSKRYEDGDHHASTSNGLGFKRKHWLEDLCLLKKLKIKESNSGSASKHCSTFSRTQFTCTYLSDSVKRPRENEVISATPSKRIR